MTDCLAALPATLLEIEMKEKKVKKLIAKALKDRDERLKADTVDALVEAIENHGFIVNITPEIFPSSEFE